MCHFQCCTSLVPQTGYQQKTLLSSIENQPFWVARRQPCLEKCFQISKLVSVVQTNYKSQEVYNRALQHLDFKVQAFDV